MSAKAAAPAKKAASKKVAKVVEPTKSAGRTREGYVVSHKMQKTLIVEVTRLIAHAQFKKVIKNKVKYSVHDEKQEAKKGDKVQIVETRPLSKTKRWRLVKVLTK